MIKDFLGNELREGDIVLRCKFSSFAFHKIIRFTKKRIVLSCLRVDRQFKHPNGNTTIDYKFLMDTIKVEDIINHNEVMYISQGANTSLIKYKKNGL